MCLFRKKKPDPRLIELEAEYQNYRRRTRLELQSADQSARKKVVQAFLPMYDDFERALSTPCQDDAYVQGIRLMQQNLLSTLRELGVEPMDSLGRCFSPAYHEALAHVTDESRGEEEIVQVLSVGFLMDGEVIRHAKVVVAN